MWIKSNDIFSELYLTVGKSIDTLLPSEKSYVIQLSVKLKEFPICDVENGREVVTRAIKTIFPIRINSCKLIFALDGSQISMNLFNTDIRWQSGYNTVFLGKIYGKDIEHLSKWTHGKTLSISLKTSGFAKVDESIIEFDLSLDPTQHKLPPDDFDSKFLKDTGLNYSYTKEFEVNSPVISNLSSKPALNKLYDRICNLQNNLEHALRRLRHSGDALEVLAYIRQPLDSIKDLTNLTNNPTLIKDISNDLYVTTQIFTDLPSSPPGAQQAAEEVTTQLFKIFNVLFEFSSKAAHTQNRRSSQTFKINPEYIDAEFSLTLALTITNYLINRIKASCQ
jgi:hypothetical protein